jgi:hypothetical protein
MEMPQASGTLPCLYVCIVIQGDLLSAHRAYVWWRHVSVWQWWISAPGDDVVEIIGMEIIACIFLAKRLHDTFNFAHHCDQAKSCD